LKASGRGKVIGVTAFLLLMATGSSRTGASAGRPPSCAGHVAIPNVTNRVLRPFSSEFSSARREMSRRTFASKSSSRFGSNLAAETLYPTSKSRSLSLEAEVSSTVPVFNGLPKLLVRNARESLLDCERTVGRASTYLRRDVHINIA